jgi:diguanylate cyclase (GGDEF)-like protein
MDVAVDLPTLLGIHPFSLVFERAAGRIVAVGPTMEKVAPGQVGRPLEDAIQLSRPAATHQGVADTLLDWAGNRSKLTLHGESAASPGEAASRLYGVVHRLDGEFGLLVMSFGSGVVRAVARHGLSATDFAPTDPTAELLFVVEARDAVLRETGRLAARLDEARRSAEVQAHTDTLTGLANRRALDDYMDDLLSCDDRPFGLMHLDLDHFKEVNDAYGHAAGDAVLSTVARILEAEVRSDDLVSRVGGDEFVIIFRNCDDADRLVAIGERIVRDLQKPIPFDDQHCRISGSIGITVSSRYDPLEGRRMLVDADRALYDAKRAGRGCVSVAA